MMGSTQEGGAQWALVCIVFRWAPAPVRIAVW